MNWITWAIIGLGAVSSLLSNKQADIARDKMKADLKKDILKELTKKD